MTDNISSREVMIEKLPGSKPGVTILQVTGPLTIRNFFDFQDVTRSENSPVLLIDFSGVPYIDSAALGSLVGLHVSCARTNRKYALVNPSDRLRTMFEVTGVRDVLVTFPTIAQAESALT